MRPDSRDPGTGNLPRSVVEMIALIGFAPTMALVQAFAGNVIKIPIHSRPGGHLRERLVRLMGVPAAEQLIAAYGGERLSIPRCVAALRDSRDRQIIAAYDRGVAVAQLARDYALTERQIRSILKRTPGEAVAGLASERRQFALF